MQGAFESFPRLIGRGPVEARTPTASHATPGGLSAPDRARPRLRRILHIEHAPIRAPFPRLIGRGPVEAIDPVAPEKAGINFPRLIGRGPVEAAAVDWSLSNAKIAFRA